MYKSLIYNLQLCREDRVVITNDQVDDKEFNSILYYRE